MFCFNSGKDIISGEMRKNFSSWFLVLDFSRFMDSFKKKSKLKSKQRYTKYADYS